MPRLAASLILAALAMSCRPAGPKTPSVPIPAESIESLSFVTGVRGQAVGAKGLILTSSTAGESWTPSSPTSNTLKDVAFANALAGTAV